MRLCRLGILAMVGCAFGIAAVDAAAGALGVTFKESEIDGAKDGAKARLYSTSKALVIGMDHYTETGWPKLSMGIKDAEAVAEALKAQGFAVTLVKDLKSDELDRTFRNFFINEGKDPESRLFVWFAGHGHTIAGEGYLVPIDGPDPGKFDGDFRAKALSLRRFGEYMREARAKHVLAVFDSCFAGTVFTVARAAPPRAITLSTALPVRQFVSSGDADQVVSDSGAFRRLFIDALEGREPDADANKDGYITGSELGLFLFDKVTNYSEKGQTPRYGKLNAQGFDRGDFVLEQRRLDTPPTSALTIEPAVQALTANDATPARDEQSAPVDAKKTVAAAPLHECDRLAADRYDADAVAKGLRLDQIFASRALPACTQALETYPSERRFRYQQARALESAGKFDEARRQYDALAADGHAAAMNAIAAMYNNGRGVAKDHAEGNFWLTRAAEMGNADAKRWLGHNFYSGLGAVPDHAKAGRFYREAAEAGHTGAMRALAVMYDWGHGGLAPAPDPVTASRWALKALQGGDDEPFNAFWMLGSGSRASGFTPAFRREMQLRLQEAGVYNGPTDGAFSGETDAAVEALHK